MLHNTSPHIDQAKDIHLSLIHILRSGLTQDQLIAKMQIKGSNMSRSTLANIEAGRRNIKVYDLKLIKEILDVPYECFFES